MNIYQTNFTIIDVETTGGNARFGKIIEIGILRIERGELVAKFKSLVNPGLPVSEFISELTGITNRQLSRAPSFGQIAEDILPLFEDSIFVAHNSSFDYKFVKAEFRHAGLMFSAESLCTVRLSRALFPQYKHHNLTALIERFQFKCKKRHRAFDDAKVLWDFLQILQEKFSLAELESALDRTVRKISPKKQRQAMSKHDTELVYIPEFEFSAS